MSIVKFVNGKNRSHECIKKGIEYIMNPQKTALGLVAYNGVRPEYSCEDMELVQNLMGQKKGRRCIHYVLSFDKGVDQEMAYDIAVECASYFSEDYQYVLAIHTNTKNVHAHVIMSTVNIHTGRKFSQSKKQLLEFRNAINEVLIKFDLKPIGKAEFVQNWMETQFDDDDDYFYYDDYSDYDNDDNCNSYFGLVDAEEAELMKLATKQEELERHIIRYFEGRESALPDNVDWEYAEEFYEKWLNHWEEDWDEKF